MNHISGIFVFYTSKEGGSHMKSSRKTSSANMLYKKTKIESYKGPFCWVSQGLKPWKVHAAECLRAPQSIAWKSQRKSNLSAADTPVSYSDRMLAKDALIAKMIRKPSSHKDSLFYLHTRITSPPSTLHSILMLLLLLKQLSEEKRESTSFQPVSVHYERCMRAVTWFCVVGSHYCTLFRYTLCHM